MISHEFRCIFIHIPATAGTSIEEWIVGRDWWEISPRTKHLFASQARREYADYWQDYFKFSIVRDPVTRMRSCLRFPEISFVKLDETGEMDLADYQRVYSRNGVVLEYDWRFYERDEVELPRHVTHALYGNILDEDLDYIGHFEDLDGVVGVLRERLGIDRPFTSHRQASSTTLASTPIGDRTRRDIESLFWRDYKRFGFVATADPDPRYVGEDEAPAAQVADEPASDWQSDIPQLLDKISELRLSRTAYHSLIDELNGKNSILSILQETVASLIAERDAYKGAAEEMQGAMADLSRTVDGLIVDRDAYKAALEEAKGAIALLSKTVEDLVIDRDAHKAALAQMSSAAGGTTR